MGGIAAIAKQLGHQVTGSDTNVYPPMSTQLESLGITLTTGWDSAQFQPEPDLIIIGNAMSRGNPAVEYVLSRNLPYCSGPEWLKKEVLQQRWVVAASGTHGKTTTAGMVAWILESCGMNPGYLIGGVPGNFDVSARLGDSPFFVIEADEYDTAFFDKRSKFVHYLPKTLIINNLEFDHADIFKDIDAIKTQFHHLLRILPNSGLLISNQQDEHVQDTIKMGCWTPQESITVGLNGDSIWQAELLPNELGLFDGHQFNVYLKNEKVGQVNWTLTGEHNVHNALAALAATRHCGMSVESCIKALCQFKNAKRRMEVLLEHKGIVLYDDFAHHPTAIKTTLSGLRANVGVEVGKNTNCPKIIAIIEPRSNTMKMGVHNSTLANSWQDADEVIVFNQDSEWSLQDTNDEANKTRRFREFSSVDDIVKAVIDLITTNDHIAFNNHSTLNKHIVVMSNGGFGGIHQKLQDAILAV